MHKTKNNETDKAEHAGARTRNTRRQTSTDNGKRKTPTTTTTLKQRKRKTKTRAGKHGQQKIVNQQSHSNSSQSQKHCFPPYFKTISYTNATVLHKQFLCTKKNHMCGLTRKSQIVIPTAKIYRIRTGAQFLRAFTPLSVYN